MVILLATGYGIYQFSDKTLTYFEKSLNLDNTTAEQRREILQHFIPAPLPPSIVITQFSLYHSPSSKTLEAFFMINQAKDLQAFIARLRPLQGIKGIYQGAEVEGMKSRIHSEKRDGRQIFFVSYVR